MIKMRYYSIFIKAEKISTIQLCKKSKYNYIKAFSETTKQQYNHRHGYSKFKHNIYEASLEARSDSKLVQEMGAN